MNSHDIKQLRLSLNLTQKQLADKIGVSRTTVSYWEMGVFQPDKRSQKALEQMGEVNHE